MEGVPPPPLPVLAPPIFASRHSITESLESVNKCEDSKTVSELRYSDENLETDEIRGDMPSFETHLKFKELPRTVPNLAEAIKLRQEELSAARQTHKLSDTSPVAAGLPPPPPPPPNQLRPGSVKKRMAPAPPVPSTQACDLVSETKPQLAPSNTCLPPPPPIPTESKVGDQQKIVSNELSYSKTFTIGNSNEQKKQGVHLKSSCSVSMKITPPQCAPPPPPPTIYSMSLNVSPLGSSVKQLQDLTITTDVLDDKPLPSIKIHSGREFDSRYSFVDDSRFPDPKFVLKRTKPPL